MVRQETEFAKVPTKDYGLKLRGGHGLTGPIYIDRAEPGDMLEIRILAVTPRVNYGENNAGAGGAAPGMMTGGDPKIIKYAIAKKTVNFAPGIHFPIRPFMGIGARDVDSCVHAAERPIVGSTSARTSS